MSIDFAGIKENIATKSDSFFPSFYRMANLTVIENIIV
jgi:hypothetical protein